MGVNRLGVNVIGNANKVIPTHVGVNLPRLTHPSSLETRFPHTRGGEPVRRTAVASNVSSFPHTQWGWPVAREPDDDGGQSFCPPIAVYLPRKAQCVMGVLPILPLAFGPLPGQNNSRSLLKSIESIHVK